MASNWAIVIGINQYRFLQPLNYAKRDAEAMHSFLMQEAKFDRIFLFTDDSPAISGKSTEPFRANLLRVLRQIFAAPFMKDGDNFWFFFSGHGIPHNGQDYLMLLDGDPEDIENTGISTNTITNYLRSCGADNAVMILDACRSGGKKSGEGIGRQTEAEACQTGVISLFSCSPDQYSYELEAIGQGAFTYALIEGLGIRGRCATVERLNQYLEHRVPELVGQHLQRVRQIPYTIAEPLNRSHLILMPQHVSLADIATLKNDAYRAQMNQNWDLAQRLWIRVNTAASGSDMEAIEALQNLSIQRHTRSASDPLNEPSRQIEQQAQSLTASPPVNLASKRDEAVHRLYNSPPPVNSAYKREVFLTPKLDKSQPSQPSAFSNTSSDPKETVERQKPQENVEDTLTSDRGIDYRRLRDLLKIGRWKEANQETVELMLKVVDREEPIDLLNGGINEFPDTDLYTIDQLWHKYSKGRFGFSIQKKIYLECGGEPDDSLDEEAWVRFGQRVKWCGKNDWITNDKLAFYASAPEGHLPTLVEPFLMYISAESLESLFLRQDL